MILKETSSEISDVTLQNLKTLKKFRAVIECTNKNGKEQLKKTIELHEKGNHISTLLQKISNDKSIKKYNIINILITECT